MADFLIGFGAVGTVLLRIAGGLSAVLIAVAVVLVILVLAARCFDLVTARIASRWERVGHTPRSRWGRIILDASRRGAR